ncbi:MAG TPA: hypothetical protein VGL81_00735 [Polyangiaceae bacterium]
MSRLRLTCLLVALTVLFGGAAAVVASCSQTPTNVPVRTFELAQKVDVVCMQVLDDNGDALLEPVPSPEEDCAPVPLNVDGGALPFHLFAAVTQVARGELAVVDLTSGNVIDEDQSTPGINFIPVGSLPTDVAIAPDAQMTFVSSRDPNKPAIYGIPNTRLLGTSLVPPVGGYPNGLAPAPLQLTDLFACALSQPPEALTIASLPGGGYVLLAMLGSFAGESAKIAAIDPSPLLGGAGLGDGGGDGGFAPGSLNDCPILGAIALATPPPSTSWTPGPVWPDGVPYADGGIVLTDAEPSPGPTCSGSGGGSGTGGDAGDGGTAMPLAMGGLDAPHPTAMVVRNDVPLLYVADSALPVIHVIDVSDPTSPKEQAPLLATSVNNPTRLIAVGAIAISPPTHDYRRYLYAVDSNQGSVMVFDVTDPVNSPHRPLQRPHPELNPFSPPDRLLFSAPAATLAFVQHDWPLPSQVQGSSPIQQYTGLLCNPNPNAHPNPTTFLDRGAYYRADQDTVIQINTSGSLGSVENFPYRLRGIFAFVTLTNGTIVAIDVDDWDAPCRRPDPMSNGPVPDPTDPSIVYSGPASGIGMTGSLDMPEPDAGGPTDFDPYHAPVTYNSSITELAGTTLESFFPVSQPNRIRSNFLLRNDPTSGLHIPNELGAALLFDVNGSLVATNVTGGSAAPLLLPTPLPPNFYDPTYLQNPTEPDPNGRLPLNAASQGLVSAVGQSTNQAELLPNSTQTAPPGVRVSFDDPTAQQDQDWTVTYEGSLPSLANIALEMASDDDTYQTLTLSTGLPAPDGGTPLNSGSISPGLCGAGIEDWTIGQARANAVLAALQTAGLPAPGAGAQGNPKLTQWTSDYVELADDLLPQGDPYWATPSSTTPGQEQDCWDPPLADPDGTAYPSPLANDRYTTCANQYGADGEDAAPEGNQSVADINLWRDLPILEAYDDHLVLGRFGWLPQDKNGATVGEQTNNRVVVGPDPSNAPFLRLARCCFHHQATFKVRTGGEWLAIGSATGLLHHVQADPSTRRCVLTCNPTDVLENARSFDIPWSTPPTTASSATSCTPPGMLPAGLDRNSVLAMRNPMFSFVMWSGCTPLAGNDHTETARDLVWKFSMRGGFSPVTVSISQNTTTAVLPQSMRFIDSLGQLAVVDGAQQGLILIDLNTLQFAHDPYY